MVSWKCMLIFISGFINSSALIHFSMAVTHHTGNVSALALSLGGMSKKDTVIIALTMLSFFAGGVLSGFVFYKKSVGFSKIFGMITIINGICYFMINSLFFHEIPFLLSTSLIAGIQNSFLTRYGNVVTRTTHLTGYLTDSGVYLGRCLRGNFSELKYITFIFTNIFFFILGALFSTWVNLYCKQWNILIPSCLQILAGAYYLYCINHRDSEEKILKKIS